METVMLSPSPPSSPPPPPVVVRFENVHFGYQGSLLPFGRYNSILNDLNLNVRHGQIYALLGPSGCGKTTSMQLILGLVRPRSGNVTVFGIRPNTPGSAVPGPGCGYMPQDLALMPSTNVQNNFYYYGRINGLSDSQIVERIAELMALLELPEKFCKRRINELSGGQQRRISMAIALMHRPSLLMLDEPTVGLDPLLISQVWKHLHAISAKYSTTIILTTHYIEEAHHAHVIGLMRDGRLLAEDSPSRLLQQYQTPSIEALFLRLCEQENKQEEKTVVQPEIEQVDVRYQPYDGPKSNQSYHFSFSRVRAIIPDVYLYFFSVILATACAFFLPVFEVCLVNYTLGPPPSDIPIVLVTDRIKPDRFIEYIQQELPASVRMLTTGNLSEAIRLVETGEAHVSFNIPGNFSRCMLRRANKGFQITESEIECTVIRTYVDYTRYPIVGHLWAYLSQAFERGSRKFLQLYGLHPELLSVPIRTEFIFDNPETVTFRKMILSHLVLTMEIFTSMTFSVFIFIEFRSGGSMRRSESCGVKPLELIFGHFLIQIPIVLIQAILLLAVLHLFIKIHGSLLLAFLIIALAGFSGISLGILVASYFNKMSCVILVFTVTTVSFLASGALWPIQSIEKIWIKFLFKLLPFTLPTEAIGNVLLRGRTMYHDGVGPGIFIAIGYIIIPLLIALIIYRRN